MNTDAILFYSIAVILTIFFLNIVFINIKVRKYVKKYHRDFWEKNIHLFFGGGRGGPNIFQVIERIGIKDSKIDDYKKEWKKALKQLFIIVLLVIIFSVSYIALHKMNLLVRF